MKSSFIYSTNFYAVNDHSLKDCCIHLLCTHGVANFDFNEKSFSLSPDDLLVTSTPCRIKNITLSQNAEVVWFAAENKFLNSLLPANNYSIGGSISLNQNPVIHLSSSNATKFLADIQRIKERMDDTNLIFYDGLMSSLCLTMIYDIFEFHAIQYGSIGHTDRAGYIVKNLMDMLSSGVCRTNRNVTYFASRLNVSPQYLSDIVRRMTGHSVTSYIDNHTIPILKQLLNDQRLSLSQIAEYMNFNTLSYFSRYCKKHLGLSPSEYRKSLQPLQD